MSPAAEAVTKLSPRRVQRPTVQTAHLHLPPLRVSPVQPAARDPDTGVLTVQLPSSFPSAQPGTAASAAQQAQDVMAAEQHSTPQNSSASTSDTAGSTHGPPSSIASSVPIGSHEDSASREQQLPAPGTRPAASEAYRIKRLWTNPRFVARRLLTLVALAKRLMSLQEQQRDDTQARLRAVLVPLTSTSLRTDDPAQSQVHFGCSSVVWPTRPRAHHLKT